MVVLGLRTLVRRRPEVEIVAYAHDADAAIAACRETRPAVAVLDMALDGSSVDGIELCRQLRAEIPDTEVVFYTGLDPLGLAEKAFDAGAKGVVSKGDRTGELLRAVLLAARGRSYTSPTVAARAGQDAFGGLSPKQVSVLRLLAQGLGRKEIAERMDIGEETVKTHLSEIRRKLGAATSAHAVAIGLTNALFDLDAEDDGD
jgi:DNA-binding NarL/FixJ family response regulator